MQTVRERGEILDVHRDVDPKHELAAVTQAAMRLPEQTNRVSPRRRHHASGVDEPLWLA